jgi:class 3 adenylate cyclase
MIRSVPWSAAMDLGDWLRNLGLGQYEELFRANEIDADILPELTDLDLEKLGVPLGHRKRLLRAISGLTAAETSAAAAASTGSKPHDAAERRQLTVMFCDLVGSTALSVRFDPEELREEIRAYQNAVSGVVPRYDGFVAKYMGDGVLAYFGYPRAHEDDAERAVRAGLEIAAAVTRLETRGTERLAVRVGIATGLVVVGDLIGEGSAQEQAVVGETPNLAARLQALAEPGQIVLAGATRRRSSSRCRPRSSSRSRKKRGASNCAPRCLWRSFIARPIARPMRTPYWRGRSRASRLPINSPNSPRCKPFSRR